MPPGKPPRLFRPARRLGALLVASLTGLGAAMPGCGPQRASYVPVTQLPSYDGPLRDEFNDLIEPAAAGLSLDRPTFRGDRGFMRRAQSATGIARMRIKTVTVGDTLGEISYHLELERLGEPLKSRGDEAPALDLDVRAGGASFSLMRQVDTRVRNRTVVALWKRFRQNDEPVLHWYLAPDGDDTTSAVREALTLQEVSAK